MPGNTILSGSDIPSSSLGRDGDFYIDTTQLKIYGPKTDSSWNTGRNLVGPRGERGAAGFSGPQGPAGPVSTLKAYGVWSPTYETEVASVELGDFIAVNTSDAPRSTYFVRVNNSAIWQLTTWNSLGDTDTIPGIDVPVRVASLRVYWLNNACEGNGYVPSLLSHGSTPTLLSSEPFVRSNFVNDLEYSTTSFLREENTFSATGKILSLDSPRSFFYKDDGGVCVDSVHENNFLGGIFFEVASVDSTSAAAALAKIHNTGAKRIILRP